MSIRETYIGVGGVFRLFVLVFVAVFFPFFFSFWGQSHVLKSQINNKNMEKILVSMVKCSSPQLMTSGRGAGWE